MRVFVTTIILLLTIYIAFDYIKKVKLHNKALNECLLMIENIEIMISYNNLSVKEIFQILSSNNSFSLLSFISKINDNLTEDIHCHVCDEDNMNYIIRNKYLNKNDKEILIKYFSMLGKSDTAGQLKNCQIFKDIIKNNIKINEKNELKECKSSGILILGIGFLFVIMIS